MLLWIGLLVGASILSLATAALLAPPQPQRLHQVAADPPQTTGITVSEALTQPLQPLTLTLRLNDYDGPAEVRWYDGRNRSLGQTQVAMQQGSASISVLPRGLPGPRFAEVLIDGQVVITPTALFTLDPQTTVKTGQADLDLLYPTIRSFLEQKVVTYTLGGLPIRGYRSPDNPLLWLRDHVYQGRGFRYFETDMTSLLDAFRRAQHDDGSFPDVLSYPALGVTAHRLETESDLEFLFVQGVYDAWQASGDTAWLYRNLPAMRRALTYITSNPLRWDAANGLVRRPYTIDTWDFQYGPTTISPDGKPAPRHWIDEQTIWGIAHGDNTGLAYALKLMERMERHLGNESRAAVYSEQRIAVMQRLNDLSWNGRFFTHFVPLDPETEIAPGVDTDDQLSLSNAYALNREVLESQQAQAIIQSYYDRRDFTRAFAEWYSIDPPFPPGSFGMGGRPGEKPGEYVNGGIMPLVGGELARGAFRYGGEVYGFDLLRRYAELIRLTGASYLWYYPDGRPGISGEHTLATDGWGSSAMLGALMEGAAGIGDLDRVYRQVTIEPRWAAAKGVSHAYVVARYAASDGYVAYTWQYATGQIALDMTGSWDKAHIRVLLPSEAPKDRFIQLSINGQPVDPDIQKRYGSRYVVFAQDGGDVQALISWS